MKRLTLIGTTALGFILGAVIVNAGPSSAQQAVVDIKAIEQDIGIYNTLQTIGNTMTAIQNAMNDVNKALGTGQFGDVQTLLEQGFTQNANYSKAQIGAQQQLMDASNTAMARFSRDMRNAQIRDEQTASPTHCAAIDGGVSTQSASVQSYAVGQTIAAIHDQRGEAGVGMPSHFGQAQGVASMAAESAQPLTRISNHRACSAAVSTPTRPRSTLPRITPSTSFSQLHRRRCGVTSLPRSTDRTPLSAATATTRGCRWRKALSITRSACRCPPFH